MLISLRLWPLILRVTKTCTSHLMNTPLAPPAVMSIHQDRFPSMSPWMGNKQREECFKAYYLIFIRVSAPSPFDQIVHPSDRRILPQACEISPGNAPHCLWKLRHRTMNRVRDKIHIPVNSPRKQLGTPQGEGPDNDRGITGKWGKLGISTHIYLPSLKLTDLLTWPWKITLWEEKKTVQWPKCPFPAGLLSGGYQGMGLA